MKKKLLAALLLAALLPTAACAQSAGEVLGFSALKALTEREGQALLSPWGLYTALSMAAEGANGQTREELLSLLGTDAPAPLPLRADGVASAAGAILDEQLTILDSYREALARYDAQCLIGLTAEAIDQWASDKTNGRIDKVTNGKLPEDARMALLSALTLDAKWDTPFAQDATASGTFYAPEGAVTVDFLSRTGRIDYAEADGIQMVRLPYAQDGLACYLLLPEEGGLEKALSDLVERGYALFEELAPAQVDLTLPRLSMDVSVDLSGALQEMGLQTATSNAADFSGVDGKDGLKLGPVCQRTKLDLDEDGTRAASVTVAYAVTKSAMMEPAREMRLDRPFVLLVRDEGVGVTLFAACVSNPAKNQNNAQS